MMTTDERIQAYLDGILPADETAIFERELADPAVAQVFGEELFLRELMRDMGPEIPDGLIERIAQNLSIAPERVERASRLPRLRAAVGGAEWMVRGPAFAFTSGPGVVGGREAVSGMRAALGSVAAPRPARPPSKPRPMWRRAISGVLGAQKTVSGVVSAGEALADVGATFSDVGSALAPRFSAPKSLWRRTLEWVRR